MQWFGCWTRDGLIVGLIPGRCNLGQVVHTSAPRFTKRYTLVPCEGFHVNAPLCGSVMGLMKEGSIVVACSAAILIF